jgi:hypothetical protein
MDTHNLKILLFNSNDDIIQDNITLNKIKKIFTQNNTVQLEWNGKNENITIKWNLHHLKNHEQHFMGDLFTHSIYEQDSLIHNHTMYLLSQIKCNYIIKFYISRVIRNTIPITNLKNIK